jgi:hypothetical protein
MVSGVLRHFHAFDAEGRTRAVAERGEERCACVPAGSVPSPPTANVLQTS